VGLGALTAREAEGKTGDKVRVFTIPISSRAKEKVMVLECSDDSVMESVMHNEVMLRYFVSDTHKVMNPSILVLFSLACLGLTN